MVELLAPAGDIDSGFAAFSYGADAVYLGLNRFSARAEATNFTPEQFFSFSSYVHSLGKKVLVAVNTVLFEDEKESLIETLQIIEQGKADGVIVQDLGTAYLIKKYFPSLRLHASTQLAAHNKEGVIALKNIGFKRVVLARELSLEEITEICKIPDIEIEVFVHGALCYAYSGLCMFSSIYTGRSANRGKCVYPCREKFEIGHEKKHLFSMKDLTQNENVLLLQKAGVDALKIEGRKKSPLYVSAVTDYYRSILDGQANKTELNEKRNQISCIFSRPTTELYLKDRKNTDVVDTEIVGHRGLFLGKIEGFSTYNNEKYIRFKTNFDIGKHDGIQIDLPKEERPFGFSAKQIYANKKKSFEAKKGDIVEIILPFKPPYIPEGASVYLSSSSKVKSLFTFNTPVMEMFETACFDVEVSLFDDKITASACGLTEEISTDLSPAKSLDLVEKSVQTAFLKTDKTGFKINKITTKNPKGLFVPMSVLNELRRNLYDKLKIHLDNKNEQAKILQKQDILSKEIAEEKTETTPIQYSVKTDDVAFLKALEPTDLDTLKEILFEINIKTNPEDFNEFNPEKLRFALPNIARDKETEMLIKIIKDLLNKGFYKFEIGNMWGLTVFKNEKIDLSFDWGLYVANISAARMAIELGATSFIVSPEAQNPTEIFKAFPDKAIGLACQDIPLFVSETCPYVALNKKCIKCGGNKVQPLKSKYGEFISVMKNCRHFLYADKRRIKKSEMINFQAKLLRIELMGKKTDALSSLKTMRNIIYS